MLPEKYYKSAPLKALLVDDDEIALLTLSSVLKISGFDVATATNVSDALKLISMGSYDVLLSDLHMPGAGDGLTVVSAMRHSNPGTVTMLLSSFPEMNAAAMAILLQADEILVKSMDLTALIEAIKRRVASGHAESRIVESVATILERAHEGATEEWFSLVQREDNLMQVPLSRELRCEHLPQLFRDLIHRLRSHQVLGSKEVVSIDAARHGTTRLRQGYTAAMMVQESRLLQVCIFNSLQKNLATINFSVLLSEVMTIADEVDSQLTQAMESYVAGSVNLSVSTRAAECDSARLSDIVLSVAPDPVCRREVVARELPDAWDCPSAMQATRVT
jgi:YesN/AraC family two-component response regulator